MGQEKNHLQWKYGAVPLGRNEPHGSLPYGDLSFDYIMCLNGIEHTENPSNAVREFHRMLKKEGKLYISLPNYLTIERRLRFLFTGSHSKIPSHEALREIWKGDLSMAHLSPLGTLS